MSRLLQDKVFISTRPDGQADELAQLFTNAGATVIEMPLVKIQPAHLSEIEKKYFEQLHHFQWLIFTSTNGVRYFFENLQKIQGNQNLPASLQLAVIGDKTGQVLNSFGYKATFANPGSTGEDFAEYFIQKIQTENTKPNILLAFGNIARNVIQNRLNESANCTRLNLYETKSPETIDNKAIQLILSDQYEMLLFTSPSGIRNLLKLAKEIQPEKLRIACIGETTANAAIENNISPVVVAKNSTVGGLFESVLNYYKNIKQQKLQL
ncbi:MAG TPA: uroporphyrinogen-III synthase [Draconibacterium sp.]|nr:uroporphyrinogen-III synthase [Draconibacterium sp.]